MMYALLRTPPGRALLIGASVKLVAFVVALAVQPPVLVRLLDSAASVMLVAAGT